jgi:hypothetical protein
MFLSFLALGLQVEFEPKKSEIFESFVLFSESFSSCWWLIAER